MFSATHGKSIRDARHKLKPTKCTLACPSIEFLGYVVSCQGISLCPEKLLALSNMAPSFNAFHVRTIIGMALYYWRFVPGFALIDKPLLHLSKKGEEFVWMMGLRH